MAIYEYRCQDCGKEFEEMQKITDDPLTECKFCQGRVKRLISNTAFQLKGEGWYVTDYKKKPTEPKKESKDSTKESKTPTEKSTKKPKSNSTQKNSKPK